ncbi:MULTISPECIES: pirin family protein [unclassified Arcicella]|uniref:pirin family protein n=1 Tax=unclassified Arcicella TaxID=2644986 RepID=UPI002860EF19|nr:MULTISPECIES: pirin family protein [unclassified Arcicella]MDR6564652.1 redox-sensitive bicupin YhaK (pirin superfamily) [Arcicella sp. BE51]MDR6814420.1 redox-sensitive bicupin YhaK (pirin superfamily) [Arcicella sp. BE140]MDR6825824.1 redox-sensitive bicupin YhaK (pirin superfamily) [Arcicella sp. BE139]
MKKQTSFSTKGSSADLGPLSISRMLPNRYADKVGPFVFLDYVAPAIKEIITKNGMGAHPHRGIATLTYVLQGEVEHFDSAGNTGKIYSGGAQWMKAGNGIIHDENFNYDSQTDNKYIHGLQFWLNLPAKNKAEKPAHIAIQANEVPIKTLPNEDGWIKVVVGKYEELSSIIPNYSAQFLYHVHLNAGKQFSLEIKDKIEVAAFLPTQNAVLNDTEFQKGEFVEFDREAGEIELKNTSDVAIDILLFGGEEYTEPIVAEGPFVMNTQGEIADAYRDFHAGKYGKIRLTK